MIKTEEKYLKFKGMYNRSGVITDGYVLCNHSKCPLAYYQGAQGVCNECVHHILPSAITEFEEKEGYVYCEYSEDVKNRNA